MFALLAMLINGGLTMGICASDSLFLSELGSEKLPYIYLLFPLLMLFVTPLSSYAQERLSIEKVVRSMLWIEAAVSGVVGLFAYQWAGHFAQIPLIYFAKLFTAVCYVGGYTVFWNYVDAHFSILEGKRLYGIINAGSCFGIMVFGGVLVALSNLASISYAYYLWAFASLAALPLLGYIQRNFKNLEENTPDVERLEETRSDAIRSTFEALRQSKYALFLGLLYFLLPILNCTNEYLSYSVFSAQGDAQQIAALFGKLYGGANILNLLISLFLFNGLVSRFGVRNLVLVQPVLYFFVFVWYFGDLSFAAAIFGFFAYQSILPSIDNNNANLLFNALPAGSKRSIRTFIEGLGEPVAIAISGAFLLWFMSDEESARIALVAVGVSVLVGGIAYAINQLYVIGIHKNLSRNWIDLSERRKSAFHFLQRSMGLAGSHRKIRSNSCDLESLVPAFRFGLDSINGPQIRALFHCGAFEPDATRAVLLKALTNANAAVKQRFKDELAGLDEKKWKWARPELCSHGLIIPLSAEPMTMTEAVVTDSDLFRERLNRIVFHHEECQLPFLVRHLQFESTRLEALTGISQLVQVANSQITASVMKHLQAANPEELLLIFRILEKTKHVQSVSDLLRSRVCFSLDEKRKITEIILQIGARTVPILMAIIRDSSVMYSNRSLALNVLAKLSFPQINLMWKELAEQGVEQLSIYHRHAASIGKWHETGSGLKSLRQAYIDLRNETLEWILELLAVVGKIPDFLLLLHSLKSHHSKERANGVELLIEGVGMKFYRRIEPYLSEYSDLPSEPWECDTDAFSLRDVVTFALVSGSEMLVLSACHCFYTGEHGLAMEDFWERVRLMPDPELPLRCMGEYLVSEGHPESGKHEVHRVEKLGCILRHPILRQIRSSGLLSLLSMFELETLPRGAALSPRKWYFPLGGVPGLEMHGLNRNSLRKRVDDESQMIMKADALCMTLDSDALKRLIRIFPKVGFQLLTPAQPISWDAE